VLANSRHSGFSLIELVAGIVVFSIAMVIVVTLVLNQTQQSINPVLQTRAATLAKSLAAEIFAKAYDENSTLDGSLIRCDDAVAGALACTSADNLGPDGTESLSRANFDDVDDYNGLVASTGADIANALGVSITNGAVNLYQGYSLSVNVSYAVLGGITGKQIQIRINAPSGDTLDFAFYKMNY
jgi:MSHA pilin protein MshD